MPARRDPPFAPPPSGPSLLAVLLALAGHAVLIGVLLWAVPVPRVITSDAVEAELWSDTFTQAAAAAPTLTDLLLPAAPQPTPAPDSVAHAVADAVPAVVPGVASTALPQSPSPAAAPQRHALPDAELALQRQHEQERQAEEARIRALEAARQAALQAAEEQKRQRLQREQQAREQAMQERLAREAAERAEKERQAKVQAARQEQEKARERERERASREAAARKKAEEAARRQEQAATEALRRQTLQRMQALAGGNGSGSVAGVGTAAHSSGPNGGRGLPGGTAGPSAEYGARVAARVKPHIVYPNAMTGNPRAEVRVRAAPDGTIVDVRLAQPSGQPVWDEAVLRALRKTAVLPRDEDGRVPAELIIGFRPQD